MAGSTLGALLRLSRWPSGQQQQYNVLTSALFFLGVCAHRPLVRLSLSDLDLNLDPASPLMPEGITDYR